MKVPFVDLHAQYLTIKQEIDTAIAETIKDSAYIGGNRVSKFESEFADWLGVNHFVACANGTDSIEILLDILGIGPGDEVIVPALSWISTSEAVGTRGATPIFVDIDASYCLNAAKIEQHITSRTKCIIPVHLYGHPADMETIMEIANRYHIYVLEDCAQAHGARINGKKVGTFGHCASFSFYPGKNLGAYGDAGGMATNDDRIAEKARMIANHGQPTKHTHLLEGRNSRMDGIQAAILSVKLAYLDEWTNQRRKIAAQYNELLQIDGVQAPIVSEYAHAVYHLYVVQCQDRHALQNVLTNQKIDTAIHYPTPLPLLDCYKPLMQDEQNFPVAMKACRQILSLPIYPEMTPGQVSQVAQAIQLYYDR
jgi:dTDP-4-amino-4,6-dideoxygalactose transaminase